MDEVKATVLRSVFSFALEFVGVWLMAGTYFFSQGGPRFLSLEAMMATAAAAGWLALRGGWSLR